MSINDIIENPGEWRNWAFAALPLIPANLKKAVEAVGDEKMFAKAVKGLDHIDKGWLAEEMAMRQFSKEGYARLASKLKSDQGIDLILAKTAKNGDIEELLFVEAKFSSEGRFRLSTTSHGEQMSKEWLAEKLRLMARSDDPEVRETARKIREYLNNGGKPGTSGYLLDGCGDVRSVPIKTP